MSTSAPSRLAARRLEIVYLGAEPAADGLAQAVRIGLTSSPKTLPCRFFYDEAGSLLFEEICGLDEYYPTRTEDAILREHAEEMLHGWRRPPVLVELGSGSSTKTRRLIASAFENYGELHYVPIDVSAEILESSAKALVHDFPRLRVTALAGDYHRALDRVGRYSPKCVAFLGSSLGNYAESDAIKLLSHIARAMGPDDRLLLGTDLAKDRDVLRSAYDDARGVTAAFNKNLLARINRELGADFDLGGFEHRADYHAERGRVEMHLVSRRSQQVNIPGCDLSVRFSPGETIHTENSHKYTIEALRLLAERSGFVEEASWTDPRNWFRVQRWRIAS